MYLYFLIKQVINMDSKLLEIYIPRILGNVTQKMIKNSFHNLNIGKVFYIDMYKKINENGYPYYFAFISVSLYNSKFADLIANRIREKKIFHLVYDSLNNQYWELKQHISRDQRITEHNKNTSFYNQYEKELLIQEYELLEKEIFSLCC